MIFGDCFWIFQRKDMLDRDISEWFLDIDKCTFMCANVVIRCLYALGLHFQNGEKNEQFC